MFADDTKIFSSIKSQDDVIALQTDLENLQHWSTVSGLLFNQSKCKRQMLARKKVPVASSYKLDDSIVSSTDSERDLGVWVSSDLTWKKQANEQTAKSQYYSGVCSYSRTLQLDERYTWHWLGRILATQHTGLVNAVSGTN